MNMRIRNLLIAVAVLAIAIPGIASAGSAYDRATGGGQILVSSDGGAGDTIAFTAQNTGGANDAAKGQIQVVDRTGGTGKGNVRLHGVVTCLRVEGNVAQMSGTVRKTNSADTSPFILVVEDNGQGAAAAQADQIIFQRISDPSCDEDDVDDDGQTDLARGNAQVYDAP